MGHWVQGSALPPTAQVIRSVIVIAVIVGFAYRPHLRLERGSIDDPLLAQHGFQRAQEIYVVAIAILDPSVSAHFVVPSDLGNQMLSELVPGAHPGFAEPHRN